MSNIQGNVTGNIFGNVIGNIPSTGNLRQQLAGLLHDGSTVAWYQPGVGVTGTMNASAWANQLGAAGSLAQATGANQPIVLPFSGVKYLYGPGVAGNNLSTPDAAPLDISSIFTIVARVALDSVAASVVILAKANASGQFSYGLTVPNGSVLSMYASFNGTTLNINTNSAAHGLSAATWYWIAGTVDAAAGTAKFYKAADTGSNNTLPSSWTQIGTTTTGLSTGTIFNSTSLLYLGRDLAATYLGGKAGRALLYNGVAPTLGGAGTLVADANAADWSETSTNGATQVSSTTGETWTLNNTGALPAQIVGSPSLLFDGTADYLKTAPFTLNQPSTVYFVGNQITWTSGTLWDGNETNSMRVFQSGDGVVGVSPNIAQYAGSFGGVDLTNMTLNVNHVVSAVYNGASSSLAVDANAADTGDAGASNGSGFTLAATGGAGLFGNIQVKEIIIRNVADSAATQARIQALLKQIHGTP